MAEERQVYPRVPASNWWALRGQFAKTLPAKVTTSYLKSLLNLTSDGAARNVLAPLRQVGLIDDDDKPTERANDWRNDAKYEDVCHQVLEEVYPSELRELFSGPGIDRSQVKQWFMHTARLGESAADQSAATYLILNSPLPSADEIAQKHAKNATAPRPSTAASRQKRSAAVVPVTPARAQATAAAGAPMRQPTIPGVHISLQVHISPEASAEQIDSIFASIARHLQGVSDDAA